MIRTGNYTLSGLAPGDYTLTPSRIGHTFSPPSRSVTVRSADVPGQDFVGVSTLLNEVHLPVIER